MGAGPFFVLLWRGQSPAIRSAWLCLFFPNGPLRLSSVDGRLTNLVVIEGHKRLTVLLACRQLLPAELEVLLGITASHDK